MSVATSALPLHLFDVELEVGIVGLILEVFPILHVKFADAG